MEMLDQTWLLDAVAAVIAIEPDHDEMLSALGFWRATRRVGLCRLRLQ